MRSSDYHPTALAALRKWTKGQRDGLVFLGQITRANLQRDQVRRVTPSSIAADLAQAKIERDLWNSHQNLRKTLDRMRSALDKLLAFMKRPETPAATYEEKEIHFLLGLVAQGMRDRISCSVSFANAQLRTE